jgi:GT2 family glycosyltransferase
MGGCAPAPYRWRSGKSVQAVELGTEGIVAIGRNEGLRLQRCLQALRAGTRTFVYVDSGSTDGSIAMARAAGAHVVELDMSRHFTAARARNAGFEHLMQVAPHTEFVQFVDADCELQPGWIEAGARALRARPDVAAVFGRRRERYPEHSVYNRLCDMEWDTPIGDSRSCGGDALVRTDAFRRVQGYDPGMIAGEEPDLCLRLSRLGLRILRIDAEMTLHDAAMTRWTQWWQRAVRTGHTSAELLAKYGAAPEHRRLRRAVSALFWGVGVPSIALALIVWALIAGNLVLLSATALVCLSAYAVLLARIRRRCRSAGHGPASARVYARSCVLAKLPETWGMLLYFARRSTGRKSRWIEYKDGPRGLVACETSPREVSEPAKRAGVLARNGRG